MIWVFLRASTMSNSALWGNPWIAFFLIGVWQCSKLICSFIVLRKPVSSKVHFHWKRSVKREYLVCPQITVFILLHVRNTPEISSFINCKDNLKWGKTAEHKITMNPFLLPWHPFLPPWLNSLILPRQLLLRKLQPLFFSYYISTTSPLSALKKKKNKAFLRKRWSSTLSLRNDIFAVKLSCTLFRCCSTETVSKVNLQHVSNSFACKQSSIFQNTGR